MKHTPGPWKVAHLSTVERTEEVVQSTFTIDTNATQNYDNEVGLANARLIAAAPDLLEALSKLRFIN